MPSALAMWIYRDGGERRRGAEVRAELVELIGAIEGTGEHARRASVEALIAAGELESALRDAGEPSGRSVCELTDALAAAALGGSCDAARALATTSGASRCRKRSRRPFRRALRTTRCTPKRTLARRARSGLGPVACSSSEYARFGTTLSAITCAALRARGERVRGITVRPTGDAYARRLELEPNDQLAVRRRA